MRAVRRRWAIAHGPWDMPGRVLSRSAYFGALLPTESM